MIKEDNLGVTNRLYLTFHESDSLCSENCKMGQKEKTYSRIIALKIQVQFYTYIGMEGRPVIIALLSSYHCTN